MRAAQLQTVLARLVRRAHRVVDKRRRRLLDVAAENLRHRFTLGELYQAARTRQIEGEVGDVQAARIQVIAGEQDAGLAIVVGHVRRLMTGDRDHVDHTLAEVDGPDLLRPSVDGESLLQRSYGRLDYRDAGHTIEALVAGDVVAVPVRVRHYQRNVPLFGDQPLNDLRRITRARAGPPAARARGRKSDTGTVSRSSYSPIRAGCRTLDCTRESANPEPQDSSVLR